MPVPAFGAASLSLSLISGVFYSIRSFLPDEFDIPMDTVITESRTEFLNQP